MKRLIAAGILFAVVLGISLAGSVSVKHYSEELEDRLIKIQEAVNQENFTSAYSQSQDLVNFWRVAEDVMAIFVNNAHINKIGSSVIKLPALCNREEKGNIMGECQTVRYLMNHISEDERFSVFSIL